MIDECGLDFHHVCPLAIVPRKKLKEIDTLHSLHKSIPKLGQFFNCIVITYGLIGKVCIIDPHPKNVNPLCDIWVCGSKPLLELKWDLVQWWWRDTNGKIVSFFDYSVKLSREFQRRRNPVMPVVVKVWINNNIPIH